MRVVSYISGLRQEDGKELVSSSHTLALLMSKLRSSLEAGKKQPRRSQEYGYSMEKVLLWCSFNPRLVILWSQGGCA